MKKIDRLVWETLKKQQRPISFKELRDAMDYVIVIRPSKLQSVLRRLRSEGNLRVYELSIRINHYQAK